MLSTETSSTAHRQASTGRRAAAPRKSRRRNPRFLSATEALAAGSASDPDELKAPSLSATLNGLVLRDQRAGVERVWLWLGGDRHLVPSSEGIEAPADLAGAKELFERWRDFAGPRGVILRQRDAFTGRSVLRARLAMGESGLVLPWVRAAQRLVAGEGER